MGSTDRWWLIAHPNKPNLPVDIARDEDHARLMTERDWTVFEVVRSDILREAVEEIEEVIRLLESASRQQLPDKALSTRIALRMLADRLGGS